MHKQENGSQSYIQYPRSGASQGVAVADASTSPVRQAVQARTTPAAWTDHTPGLAQLPRALLLLPPLLNPYPAGCCLAPQERSACGGAAAQRAAGWSPGMAPPAAI